MNIEFKVALNDNREKEMKTFEKNCEGGAFYIGIGAGCSVVNPDIDTMQLEITEIEFFLYLTQKENENIAIKDDNGNENRILVLLGKESNPVMQKMSKNLGFVLRKSAILLRVYVQGHKPF